METQENKKRMNYKSGKPEGRKNRKHIDLTADDLALAARLKKFRIKYIGKTLGEASEKTGLPPSTISTFELGRAKASLTILQVYQDQYNLNMVWATKGEGADRLGATETSNSKTLQELIKLVNTFQTEMEMYSHRVDGLVRENAVLKKRIAGLEEDMRHHIKN